MKKLFVNVLFAILLGACSEKEPTVSDLKKTHAIEVSLETKHLNDTSVLLITRQNVFLKGKLVKTILKVDTLPAPGDSLQTIPSENSENPEQIAKIPKEYEFFITVK